MLFVDVADREYFDPGNIQENLDKPYSRFPTPTMPILAGFAAPARDRELPAAPASVKKSRR